MKDHVHISCILPLQTIQNVDVVWYLFATFTTHPPLHLLQAPNYVAFFKRFMKLIRGSCYWEILMLEELIATIWLSLLRRLSVKPNLSLRVKAVSSFSTWINQQNSKEIDTPGWIWCSPRTYRMSLDFYIRTHWETLAGNLSDLPNRSWQLVKTNMLTIGEQCAESLPKASWFRLEVRAISWSVCTNCPTLLNHNAYKRTRIFSERSLRATRLN